MNEKAGTIAVADTENKRIQMFSSAGNFLREIRLKTKPYPLAFTESGDVIACMPYGENQLSLFTAISFPEPSLLSALGTRFCLLKVVSSSNTSATNI